MSEVPVAAFGGTVFYFGVADDDSYPISMRTMLRNNLTLKSGVTLDRRRMLCAANEFAREHPELLPKEVDPADEVAVLVEDFDLWLRSRDPLLPEQVQSA